MNALAAWPDECTIKVVPSARDLATAPAPIVPPAPGRFSITTVWFHCSLSFWPTVRARMSVALPAVIGTTIFTGLLGKSCAAPIIGANATTAASHGRRERSVRMSAPLRGRRQAVGDRRVFALQLDAGRPG